MRSLYRLVGLCIWLLIGQVGLAKPGPDKPGKPPVGRVAVGRSIPGKTQERSKLPADFGLRPILPKVTRLSAALVGPDPIRFTMQADRDSVAIGEAVTITITAELLPILPSQLFFFESQRSFSLKVLLPDGFIQTGGTYYDYTGNDFKAGGTAYATFTLQGQFTHPVDKPTFTLLRGARDVSATTLFARKAELILKIKSSNEADNSPATVNPPLMRSQSVAATSSGTNLPSCADADGVRSPIVVTQPSGTTVITQYPYGSAQLGFGVYQVDLAGGNCGTTFGLSAPFCVPGTMSWDRRGPNNSILQDYGKRDSLSTTKTGLYQVSCVRVCADPQTGGQSSTYTYSQVEIDDKDLVPQLTATCPPGDSTQVTIQVTGCLAATEINWYNAAGKIVFTGRQQTIPRNYDGGTLSIICGNACNPASELIPGHLKRLRLPVGNFVVTKFGNQDVSPVKTPDGAYSATISVGSPSDFFKISGCDAGQMYINDTLKFDKLFKDGREQFNWSFEASSQSRAKFPIPITTTTYKLSCKSGCIQYDQYARIVVPSDTSAIRNFSIFASSPSVCAGSSVTLTAQNCPNGTVQWSIGGLSSLTVVAVPTGTTAYSATCTLGNRQQTAGVSVLATSLPPQLTSVVNGTGTGQTVTLTATGCPAGSTIQWTGPASSTFAGPIWTLPINQQNTFSAYCQTGTDCRSRTAFLLVPIPNGQTPLISTQPLSRSVVCAGEVLTVAFSVTGSIGVGNEFIAQLSDANGSFSSPLRIGSTTTATGPILATLPLSLIGGSSYRIRVISTVPTILSLPSTTTLTISSRPSVTAISNSPGGQLVPGSTLILTATGQGLPGGTYLWRGPASFTSSTANPTIPVTTSANSGIYTVIVTAPGGCTATAQTSVGLASPCGLAFSAPPVVTCGRMTVNLGNIPAGASPTVTLYRQASLTNGQPTEAFSQPLTGTLASFSALPSGTYTVVAEGNTANTCTISTTATVVAQPSVLIDASLSLSISPGQSVILTATGSSKYRWSTNETDAIIMVYTAGVYSVTATNSAQCSATGSITIIAVSAPRCTDANGLKPVIVVKQPNNVLVNTSYPWNNKINLTGQCGAAYTLSAPSCVAGSIHWYRYGGKFPATNNGRDIYNLGSQSIGDLGIIDNLPLSKTGWFGLNCSRVCLNADGTTGTAGTGTTVEVADSTLIPTLRTICPANAQDSIMVHVDGCATADVIWYEADGSVAFTGPDRRFSRTYVPQKNSSLWVSCGRTPCEPASEVMPGQLKKLRFPLGNFVVAEFGPAAQPFVRQGDTFTVTAPTGDLPYVYINVSGCEAGQLFVNDTSAYTHPWKDGREQFSRNWEWNTLERGLPIPKRTTTYKLTCRSSADLTQPSCLNFTQYARIVLPGDTSRISRFAIRAGSPVACADGAVTLTATGCNGGGTVVWSTGQTGRIVTTPVLTGVFSATCTLDTYQQIASTSVSVSSLSVTAASNSPVGQLSSGLGTLQLTGVASVGASLSWTGPNAFTATVQNPTIPNATTAANGFYTLTASLSGCSATATTGVTITPADYLGMVEGAGCGLDISGWIIDRNHANQSDSVRVYVDGLLVATPLANGYRRDIRDTYFPDGTFASYGFFWAVPAPYKTGVHTIQVKDLTGNLLVGGSGSYGIAPPSAITFNGGANPSVCQGTSLTIAAGCATGSLSWTLVSSPSPGAITTGGFVVQPGNYIPGLYQYAVQCKATTGCVSVPMLIQVAVNPLPTVSISGNLTFCAGQSTTLIASSPGNGGQYRWSTGELITAIRAGVAGPYSVTVTNGAGCTATTSVSVGQATGIDSPTLTARVAGSSISQSLTLTAACPANSVARWTGPGSSTTTGPTWVLPFAQTNTYSALCQPTGAGCNSNPVTIAPVYSTVQAPLIGVIGKTLLCIGEPTSLTATGCLATDVVRWSGGQTGNPVSVAPTVTTTYTATCVRGEVSGDVSNGVTITVQNGLTVKGPTSYSVGQTISLTAVSTATGSVTYTWSGPSSFSQAGAVLRILGASVNQSGSYTVTARPATGCIGSVTVLISVTALGTISTLSPSRTAACPGSTLTVPFSTTGVFDAGNLFTAQLGLVGSAFATSVVVGSGTTNPLTISLPTSLPPGTYQVRVVSSSPAIVGTASTTTLLVTGTPSVTASSNSPAGQVTAGATLGLTASGQNLAGATYAWTGPASFTSSVANPTIPVTTSANNGIYTVTVTTPGGCTATGQTSVSLASYSADLLAINAFKITISSTSVCAGGAVTLTASGCPGGSIAWNTGSASPSIVVTATTLPVNYTATCTLRTAKKVVTTTVVVAPLPKLTLTTNTGSAGSLTLTATGYPTGSTVAWRGPAGRSFTGPVWSLTLTPPQTATFTASYTTTTGCPSATATVPVSVVVSVVASIATQSPSVALGCPGGSLSLPFSTSGTFGTGNVFTAQLALAGNGFATSIAVGSGASSPLTITLPTTLTAGSYQLRVVSTNPVLIGSTSPINLSVTATPSVTATSNSPAGQVMTGGNSLSLTASGQNLTGATYAWTGPASFTSNVANPTIPVTTSANSGTYTVTVTTPGGCTTTGQTSVLLTVSFGCTCLDCDLPAVKTTDNPGLSAAPSPGQNYVMETNFLTADAATGQQMITYFDGLGRPTQKVSVGTGGQGATPRTATDVISYMKYDAFGREPQKFLPYAAGTNNGAFRTGDLSGAIAAYQQSLPGKTGNAFVLTDFEASPLNRPLTQTAPGNTTPTSITYRTNTAGEVPILNFKIEWGQVLIPGNYDAGQLYVTQTVDENSNPTIEFKDKEGRVVCKDVAGRRTLYGYDDFGRLRVVAPPQVSRTLPPSFDAFTTGDLMFGYDYDARGRIVRKRVPGAGIATMTYDNRDRMISATDANGNTVNTDYDDLNRVTTTRLGASTVLTRSFYDGYGAEARGFDPTSAYGVGNRANVTGMPTTTQTLILGTSTYLTATSYYDELGRVIQTVADNHRSGTDRASSRLDLAGRVLESKLTTVNSTTSITIEQRTAYEIGGRVKSVCQRVSDNQQTGSGSVGSYWEPVARHAYNGIGELTTKTLGCNLQQLDYQYQMRGWLTQINNPTSLDNGPLLSQKDFFGMSLGYDPVGNITTWNYANAQRNPTTTSPLAITAGPQYGYAFTYDNLNRLTSGTLNQNGANAFTLNNLAYDENGNIQTLNRSLAGVPADVLTYTYQANSNQLYSVTDAANQARFAKSSTYSYDANGNLTTDAGKSITAIAYNHLNLPSRITRSVGGVVSYTYTASGQKLTASFPASGTVVAKKYDYVGGLVYANNQLEFIPTAEGRVLPPATAKNPDLGTGSLVAPVNVANKYYRYEYSLKDHLGNLRVSCRCGEQTAPMSPAETYAPVAVQTVQYDPWGMQLPSLSAPTTGGPVNRYTFLNREEQGDLGYDDLMARFYEPATGRFTSVDPVTEGQESQSVYQYAYNDPITKSDPDGKCPNCAAAGVGAIVGGLIGGGIEITSQYIAHGEVNDWRAVGGASLRGAITGGVAGFTGGGSLMATAALGAGSNVIGGVVSNLVQGKENNAGTVLKDAATGAGSSIAGKAIGVLVEKAVVSNVLEKLAGQAQTNVTSSTGKIAGSRGFGTAAHSEFKSLVDAKGLKNVATEKSFLNGRPVPYGTPGSSRADAVLMGKGGNVRQVFDLKTGSAVLSPNQAAKYLQNVPGINSPKQITTLR